MCTPTAAAIGAGIGTATKMYGSYTGALAANNMADYQAGVARGKAAQTEVEAEYIRDRSLENAEYHNKEVSKFVGEQRAFMGSSGVVVDEGSFADITEDTVRQGKLDELAILYEGDVMAWQKEMEGIGYLAQAEVYDMSKVDPNLAMLPGLMQGFSQGMSLYGASQGGGGSR